jgi:hypothetical protein
MSTPNWVAMSPDDGYFARLHVIGDVRAWLVLGVSEGGKIRQLKDVAIVAWPTMEQIGDLRRKLIVLMAVAEYLNAGGDPKDLPMMVGGIDETLWLHGWSYFNTGITADGSRVHEYVDGTGERFVRWVRNEFIDIDLTLEQIADDDTGHIRTSAATYDADRRSIEAERQDGSGPGGLFGADSTG